MDLSLVIIIAVLILVPAVLIYCAFVALREKWRTLQQRPPSRMDGLNEEARRLQLVSELGQKKYIIVAQGPGFIQAQKAKASFSILLFIVLCLLWVVPGILYLIWYMTRGQKMQTFMTN